MTKIPVTLLGALCALGVACNSADFGGRGGGTGDNKSKDDGGDAGDTDSGQDAPDGQGEAEGADQGDGPDAGDTDGEGDTGGKDGTAGEDGDDASCFAKKAAKYNFVLVFDASKSQEESDPTNLRVSGAKGFVKRLGDIVEGKGLKVRIGSISFAAQAGRGEHGWMDLEGQKSVDEINEEIDQVNAQLNLGTNYLGALDETLKLLEDIDASADDKDTRTFVLFMTDGEPNRIGSGGILGALFSADQSLIDEINAKVDDLVKKTGAAMVAVATGTEIKDKGADIVKGMAKPEEGIVNPKHKGVYKRVATAGELKKLDEVLLGAVADCE